MWMWVSYLEIREVFLHKAIDLTDWEAASFAVLQSHGNQTAAKNYQKKTLFQYSSKQKGKYTKNLVGIIIFS